MLKLFAQHYVLPYDPELLSQPPLEPWPEETLELHVLRDKHQGGWLLLLSFLEVC